MAGASALMASRAEQAGQRLARAEVSGALAVGSRRAWDRLGHAQARLAWAFPAPAADAARRRLGACAWRQPVGARLASGRSGLRALAMRSEALSPQHVVERGFAIVRGPDGRVVRSPAEVAPGDPLVLTVAQGRIDATVAGPGAPAPERRAPGTPAPERRAPGGGT
jgi:exodeoxyribonuclease VII large subunit